MHTTQWEAEQAARPQDDSVSVLSSLERRPPHVPMPWDPHVLFLAYGTESEILWDVVDELLQVFCTEPLPPETNAAIAWFKGGQAKRTGRITGPLNRLLEESRSVYEITTDQRGLRRRMEASLGEGLQQASSVAGDAGYPAARLHLARCRDRLFALHPDPSGAYVEAILSVEAVACPMFPPREKLPTLGKVLAHLRNADRKYEYVLTDKSGTPGSTAGVAAMISDLWEGHSDRHAGGPLSVPVTQESAEAALTIATSLVTLFSKGAVRPRVASTQQP